MQALGSNIRARSRRQAMDWSLVLLSQGIESVIQREPDEGCWSLAVSPADYDKALQALSQYELENRGWPWQQKLPVPGFRFDWAAMAWLCLLVVFYALQSQPALELVGVMDSQAVRSGQWWRPFTAVWLHADLGHLGTNGAIGLALLGLAMGHFGTGTGVLAAYLAGVGGNLLPCFFTRPHHSLGASGLVMGALGLVAVCSWTQWRDHPNRWRMTLGAMAAGLSLFVLLGLTPGTDITAHFGGFFSGLVFGILLAAFPRLSNPKSNLFNGFLFTLLVIIPWWAALRHAR